MKFCAYFTEYFRIKHTKFTQDAFRFHIFGTLCWVYFFPDTVYITIKMIICTDNIGQYALCVVALVGYYNDGCICQMLTAEGMHTEHNVNDIQDFHANNGRYNRLLKALFGSHIRGQPLCLTLSANTVLNTTCSNALQPLMLYHSSFITTTELTVMMPAS